MARKYAIGQAIPDPISQGLDALRQGLIAARANKDSALERALREKQLEASNRQAEFEKQKFETENAPIDFDPLRSYYTPEEQSRYEQTYGVSDATGKKTIKIPAAVIKADIERKKVMAELAKTNKESDERVSISDLIAARNNPLGSNIKIKPSDLDQVVPKPATEKEGYAEIPAEEYFKSINQPVPPRFQGKTLKVKLPDYGEVKDDKLPSDNWSAYYARFIKDPSIIQREAPPKISKQADVELSKSIFGELGQDRRQKAGFANSENLQEKNQDFTAEQNQLNRELTRRGQNISVRGQNLSNEQAQKRISIDEQRLATAQDEYSRKVLNGEVSPIIAEYIQKVGSGELKAGTGMPYPRTDRDKDALELLFKGNNSEWLMSAAGKAAVKRIAGFEPETKADAEAARAIITAVGTENRFNRTMTNQILNEGEKDLTARTKDLVEQKALIRKSIPDLLSGESGRAEAAQQRLAAVLNRGRPSDSDYNRAGIVGGAKKKMQAYFSALISGKVPPAISADRARFFADVERVVNERISREVSESVLGVQAKFQQTGTPVPKNIPAGIGATRFSTDSPAQEAVNQLEEQAAEEAAKPGMFNNIFGRQKPRNNSTKRSLDQINKELQEIDKQLGNQK